MLTLLLLETGIAASGEIAIAVGLNLAAAVVRGIEARVPGGKRVAGLAIGRALILVGPHVVQGPQFEPPRFQSQRSEWLDGTRHF